MAPIVLPLMDYLFGTLYREPNAHDSQESP